MQAFFLLGATRSSPIASQWNNTMEYDFTYHRDTGQFGLSLGAEHEVLGRFLLDEFGQDAQAYQPLVQQLTALKPHQSFQYRGREFMLDIEDGEVSLNHNSLFCQSGSSLPQQQQSDLAEDNLQLDQHGMTSQCGLEDLLKLLQDWQAFLQN